MCVQMYSIYILKINNAATIPEKYVWIMMTKSIALTAPPSIIPYQNKRSRTSAMIPADKMAEIGFELLLLSSTMKLPFKPLLTNFGFCD